MCRSSNSLCPCPCPSPCTCPYLFCMFTMYFHVYPSCLCPCCPPPSMFVSMLHVHVHPACPCSRCMFVYMLYSYPCNMSMSMLHVHVNAACPCPCCMSLSMSMLHVACPGPCPGCMSLLHVYVHNSCQLSMLLSIPWTGTWNTDMGIELDTEADMDTEHGHRNCCSCLFSLNFVCLDIVIPRYRIITTLRNYAKLKVLTKKCRLSCK
jgi:hypothetical protein